MSGTLPTTPGFAEAALIYDQPVVISKSESRRRQTRIVAGHLWKIAVSYPPMTRDEFAPIFAFAVSQRGAFDTFTLTLPQHDTPRGTATGTPLVNGAHGRGAVSISTDGWTNNITGIMKAGDILKFASHSKVYMITADANSGPTTGPATLLITPPLIESLADNEVITVNDVPFTVGFKNRPQEFKTKNPSISKFALDLEEAIA